MQPTHPIHIFINRKKYELDRPEQTGAALKELAGIPLADALFRQGPGDDEVITNETTVILRNGDHLHSQPAADYGLGPAGVDVAPERITVHTQPDGWAFVVVGAWELPPGFEPRQVQLLVKLPPLFPDAAPDMFWVHPPVRAPNGAPPRSTSVERLLDREWQRFSWHLSPGSWQVGASTLRDYLRCVAARFLRLD